MTIIFGLVLGSIIGSFLNVVIYRLPRHESLAWPPSHCPKCDARLTPVELIPIISFAWQRGRCKHCGEPISWRYPLVESLGAASFALAAWRIEDPMALLLAWALLALLIALAFIDLDHLILPDTLTYPGLALGVLAAGLGGLSLGLEESLMGAGLAAGVLVLVGGYGTLVLLRGRDEPHEVPVGLHQVYLAGALGGFFGVIAGVALAVINALVNFFTKRNWTLPAAVYLALIPVAAILGYLILPHGALQVLMDAGTAAGMAALLFGLYWAFLPEPAEEDETPTAMGFGDVKFAGLLGAWLGFNGFLLALVAAALVGSIVGIFMGQRRIPFGPFLSLGGVVALLFGAEIWQWYFSLLS